MDETQSRYAWLVSLGQFVAWVLASAGAILDALYVRQAVQAILAVLQVIGQENYHRRGGLGLDFQFMNTLTTFDNLFLLLMGCVAVAAAIGIDYYFRKGRKPAQLWKRIVRVFGIELGVVILAVLILTFI